MENTLERTLERVLGQVLTGPSVTARPARTAVPLLSWGGMTAEYTSTAPAALVAWPSQHPAARTGTEPTPLTEGLVGAGLVGVLERVEVADLDDALLLDVAARWQQVISWATAMQSRAT
ncbi:hypothetical protein ACIBBF_21875, partial [Promicromonospora sp. NPDC050880]